MVEDPRVLALKRIRAQISALREHAWWLRLGIVDTQAWITNHIWEVYWSWIAIRDILSIMMSEFSLDLTDEEIFEELHGEHVARW